MINGIRFAWLGSVAYFAWSPAVYRLITDTAIDSFDRAIAVGQLEMSGLALLVIAVTFGRSALVCWTLLILASLWALYFFLSLVAGDEGVWYLARLPPALGLLLSVLTVRWARARLRRSP